MKMDMDTDKTDTTSERLTGVHIRYEWNGSQYIPK